MLLAANWRWLERQQSQNILSSAQQCNMEQYPQIVAWEVHVGQEKTIKYHTGGAALGQDTRGEGSPSLEVFQCWLDTATANLGIGVLWMRSWAGHHRGALAPPQDGTNCPLLTARPGVATCSVVAHALLQTAGEPLSNPVGPGHRDTWEGNCVTPLNPLCNASLVRHTFEILT